MADFTGRNMLNSYGKCFIEEETNLLVFIKRLQRYGEQIISRAKQGCPASAIGIVSQ